MYAPAAEKVVAALSEQSGEIVVPHGASAANILGLTQQVPVRAVYLTSGRSRKLKLGQAEIWFKHAPHWMLALTGSAGTAVRALDWMGAAHAARALTQLRQKLPPAEWRTLAAARASFPTWMAQAIGRENAHD
ncbi:hypothetical protein AGMMS50225_28190 [Betaproteobacteria bacterium]|nr:hypothetical protein AGMMS50225_28190 [Betaproteobacteria bacterium]